MPGASGERFAAPGGKLTLDEALSSARETRALVIGSDVLRDAPTLFAQQFPGCSAVIVADERTFAAAGRVVSEAFAAERVRSLAPYIFRDPSLYAEMRFVNELECSLAGHDAIPVAVGSGTINDLTKLAAYRIRRPGYMCVATAASMDGYTAFGASIAHRGAKQTFECPAPVAVLADIDVELQLDLAKVAEIEN